MMILLAALIFTIISWIYCYFAMISYIERAYPFIVVCFVFSVVYNIFMLHLLINKGFYGIF